MLKRLFALTCILLAACGGREPLRPAAGEQMPIAPQQSAQAPTTEELLTPPPVLRPQRVDEVLVRSEQRQDDRFDLPPP